jgi:hypothetical protein
MKNRSGNKSVTVSIVLTVAVALVFVISEPSRTEALVVPPTFVAAILQALPAIGTVVGKLFNPTDKKPAKATPEQSAAITAMQKDSDKGKAQLVTYAQREQIVWRIVSASGGSTTNIASMLQIVSNQTKLDTGNIVDLNTQLGIVKTGVDSIVESKPVTNVFDDDAQELIAIDKVLKCGSYITDIQKNLDKYEKKADPSYVRAIQTDLVALQGVFTLLSDGTAVEIKLLADGLAAISAPTPPDPKNPKAVKDTSDAVASTAFGKVAALDAQMKASGIAYQNLNKQVQF